MENTLDRPIFLVGHPRSGTTLLASMLGRHPDVVSTPESLYLTMVRFQIGPAFARGAEAVVRRIETSPMRFLVLDRDDLLARLTALPALTERSVFETVLEAFRAADGKPRLLEKTPLHLRHLDELFDWFPNARVVWIMRDGRACIASLRKVDWASDDPVLLARQWVRNISYGLSQQRLRPTQVHMVRYEALIADAPAEIAPLLEFLDLAPAETVFDHSKEVRTVKPTETSWKGNIGRPLMSDRAEAWRTELPADILPRLDAIMGPVLARFGYGPASGHPASRFVRFSEQVRTTLVYNRPMLALMRRVFVLGSRFRGRIKGR
ncbi:MAG: sulfotransferase [Jannaschia sp.]